ncbi:MAG: phosphoribosyltransferase family protein [bacterium]
MWIDDFISLIYPRICACCGNSLWRHEQVICTSCEFHLPKTWFHLEHDNPVSRAFWGRARVESATAYLHFNKGNKVQRLIHHLKYKGRKDIGIYLGSQYGLYLKNSPFFNSADLVIPVPLHRKKLRQRGYNQSEQFGIGLATSMRIRVDNQQLCRISSSETQTRKSRFKRWENVAGIFAVKNPGKLEGKHVILVDDVITTGATLEACVQVLSLIPDIRVSIATIATTKI